MEVRPNVEQTIHPRLNVRQDNPLPGSPYVTTSRNKGALNRGAFQMGANLGNWAMPIFYVLLLCWQPPKGSPLIVQSCTDLGGHLGNLSNDGRSAVSWCCYLDGGSTKCWVVRRWDGCPWTAA